MAACELTAEQSRIIGASWLWRMEQEHLAVSVFSQLAAELSVVGCERTILQMITSAAAFSGLRSTHLRKRCRAPVW